MATVKEERQYAVLTEAVNELIKTIRGHNGYPGMVTQMALTEKSVNELSEIVKGFSAEFVKLRDDVRSMGTTLDIINERGCNFGQDIHSEPNDKKKEAVNEVEKKREKDDAVTWEYLRDRFTVPIIMFVIFAILTALPKILDLLSK